MLWFGLKKRIEILESKNKSHDKSIKQLRCPHDSFKKKFYEYNNYTGTCRWAECSECGMTVGRYKTKEEFLKAKAEDLRKQAERVEKEYCEILDNKEKKND